MARDGAIEIKQDEEDEEDDDGWGDDWGDSNQNKKSKLEELKNFDYDNTNLNKLSDE